MALFAHPYNAPPEPVEWWDQKWIDANITPKLEGRTGQEITEAQQPVKGTRKGGGKRRR